MGRNARIGNLLTDGRTDLILGISPELLMTEPLTINVRAIARSLRLSPRQVEAVVQLLEEGKTVPFIAWYRKDQTGGLEEEQIRRIHRSLNQAHLLAQRKEAILRNIDLQGKLTPELERQIRTATTTRRLEDLYLPYKPKKEGLAPTARARGLEPLAEEILQAAPSCANLEARAADFVNPDKQVHTPADALLGAGHILAEMISEHADLRKKLREVFYQTARICAQRLETVPLPPEWEATKKTASPRPSSGSVESTPSTEQEAKDLEAAQPSREENQTGAISPDNAADAFGPSANLAPSEPQEKQNPSSPSNNPDRSDCEPVGQGPSGDVNPSNSSERTVDSGENSSEAQNVLESAAGDASPQVAGPSTPEVHVSQDTPSEAEAGSSPGPSSPAENHAVENLEGEKTEATAKRPDSDRESSFSSEEDVASHSSPLEAPPSEASEPDTEASAPPVSHPLTKAELRRRQKELKRQREWERRIRTYSDLFDFQEPIRKLSAHRILSLNRAERQKMIRVWIECDLEAMKQTMYQECIPADHPHADFLRGCAEDALSRLLLPSLEREARRELTEQAENHAVEVFAKSLRKMLLQRPVRGKRILGVQPGIRNGCVFAALDEFGNVLEHGKVYLVGRPQRRQEAREKVLHLIRRYRIGLVAIGNGAGSRIFEDFLAELISSELKTEDVRYGIVSEIGASVYAAGPVGQEEFPYYDIRVRSAISIGRRVLDPLSELAKIEPAQLAAGTYQYDVKAKHLQPLLEEVVQSCVNRVGVDVNMSHPWLLRYVSGLNLVLARRLEQYRREQGPFRSRAALKNIPGLGEGTFELAAGFLRISNSPEMLDRTGIHPESYELARKILEKVSARAEDLWNPSLALEVGKRLEQLDASALAQEWGAGVWTIRHLVSELRRAGRDLREDSPLPTFKRARLKLEDLTPEMELTGTVVHITDFGAFVDIGLPENGLVHISQMAPRYVRDPREVVSVGDSVKVWVLRVEADRRRISLSMISPDRRAQAAQEARTEKAASVRSGKGPRDRGEKSPSAGEASVKERGARSLPARSARPGRRPASGSPRREFRSKVPPPSPPKLSEAVKQGKQPMRTFAELVQFFHLTRQQQTATSAQAAQPSADGKPSESAASPAVSPETPSASEAASQSVVKSSPTAEAPPSDLATSGRETAPSAPPETAPSESERGPADSAPRPESAVAENSPPENTPPPESV